MSTTKRQRRTYEAPQVGDAAARMIRALVKRAGEGDSEALEQLIRLEALAGQAVTEGGARMHRVHSWGDMARLVGLTRQAWAKRCGKLAATLESGELTPAG